MNLIESENQMERFRTDRLAQQEKIDAARAEHCRNSPSSAGTPVHPSIAT
jgi:hypothetical protein